MKETLKNIRNRLLALKRSINTSRRRRAGKSDYPRWENEQNLSPNWDTRSKRIATLIESESSIIEFGAGRLVLKTFLPENCSYTPSDLVDRGDGTIVCDLNADQLPHFKAYDIAVFSGVLEYIHDIPRLIHHLSNYVDVIIASYADTNTEKVDRRAQGWVNDYGSEKFIEIFENAGFQCDYTEEWQSQVIHKFVLLKK